MNLDPNSLQILNDAVELLRTGFQHLPRKRAETDSSLDAGILNQVARSLQDNYPYHHPFYLGQMLKPPHPIAHCAYALAMCINPNNHAHDGGRASSEMEKEAVAQLARMFGWESALGHLCSGGTMANLEALWIAREITDGKVVLASSQAHYTHERCCEVLQTQFQSVLCNTAGQMDVDGLRSKLDQHSVGTVVVTLGTTGLGAVDPLDEVLTLREQYGFRIHVDAAYGGYFKLADNLSDETRHQFELISAADSIVIDPHKHGLQPYGCGCILFKDPTVARVYKHDSPYTYFTSPDLHLGEISLECSRPGAAAVALWATLKRFPLQPGGEFAQRLNSSRSAAMMLADWIESKSQFNKIVEPELDIVVWGIAAESASESSARAQKFFDAAAGQDIHLALLRLPRKIAEPASAVTNWDQETLTCLRACLMKPEHLEWMPEIIQKLDDVTMQTLGSTSSS